MSKEMNLKRFAALLLALTFCLTIAGCKNSNDETTPSENSTEPTGSVPAETVPDETEPAFVPEDDEPVILQAGTMQKHMKGKNGDLGIYFTMEPNEIPVDTTWKTEFRPTSKDAIQLIRGGETYDIGKTAAGMIVKYSDTEYYLKLEEWLIREYFPIRDGDILKIEGIFRNAAIDVMFQIDTSYIQISEGLVFFSTEYPTGNGVNVKYVGNPTSHPNGKTTDGIYFKLEKNAVPYDDWKVEYTPASADAIQLIRDGKTHNIGNKEAGTIVKYSDTDYYLKMEKWIIKDYYPIRDGDIIVLNGKFVNSGVSTVFSISKTYIAINEGLLTFSTEYPTESGVEAQVIPTMLPHPNGFTGTGVYFKAEENSLPFDDWKVEYFPREKANIKLIRDGQTYDIANPDAGTIVKYNETDYYFKLEQWIYKDKFPFTDGDILVVEGRFVNAGLAGLMEIGKTYIAFSGGMAYFSTEYPDGPIGPTVVQGGTMSSHPDGWKSDANGGLFFKMDVNDAPFATDWSLRYVPTTTDAIKLIRDGVTTNVANTGAEMIAKYQEDSYYLEFWPISMKPIVEGDTLVIEGNFVNAANNVVLTIDRTYVTIENGQPVFSTENDTVIAAGYMGSHPNGFNTASGDGLYFTLSNNEVPYDGWNVEYEPTSAAAIQLTRGGETYKIGIPGRGTIVKFSDTEYYLKLAAWTIADYFPIVPGDVLVVEGEFKNNDNGVAFAISRSVITVGDDYSLTIVAEEPVDPTIQAGVMSSHPNGWNTASNKGMYFTLASNEVPYKDDWTEFYFPTTAENIKLVRDGQTYNIAQTDREFIVKYADTDYYLKLEKWTIGDYFPIVPGDVLVVEGKFDNGVSGVVFNISKTYISVGDGYVLTFFQELPDQPGTPDDTTIRAGVLKAHPVNGFNTSSKDGLYAVMTANTAPYDGWNIEYTPVEAGNYKLVRNGVTYDIGMPGRGTLVKYSDTEYYLKFGWCVGDYANTITVGDQLIVEGKWRQNSGGDAVMEISKTVITIGENYALTFDSEGGEPEEPDATEPETHGPMAAHSANGWTATGGLHFTMDANDLPYDSWSLRYTPTAEGNVKLIRNGQTYNVAHTARETIVKYSDTEYYYEFWTLADYKPVLAGDVLIVEGSFYNAANDATLVIAKTVITFNADGTATFATDVTEPEEPEQTEPAENDGALKPHPEKGFQLSGAENLIYATMAANSGVQNGWETEYTPEKASGLKLIRDGVTYEVGNPGQGTLVKYSDTEYCLKLAPWTATGNHLPLLAGDQIVVEGEYVGKAGTSCEGSTIVIAKTTITLNADETLTFESEESEETPEQPEDDAIPVGGMMANASGLTNAILYFSLADNELPSGLIKSDFRPTAAGVIKLIRDGVTYEVGNPDTKTIVKQTASKYRLLRSSLTMELQAGDILMIEGKFTGGNTGDTVYNIYISKTYILIGDGEATFTDELPSEA